mgnify:CR=1 FL=1
MGTRGTYGFYKNGVNKLAYMQFDSYPQYLGKHIVEFIRGTSIEEMNQIFDKKGQKFIKKRLSKIRTSSIDKGTIIGHPSNLNYDNSCYFYKSKIKLNF